MASCPCCGEPLSASAQPSELCAACGDAMDIGADATQAEASRRLDAVQRPIGVSLLAIVSCGCGVLFLIAGLFIVAKFVLNQTVESSSIGPPYLALLCILLAGVTCVFGWAFWCLMEWIRLLAMAFLVTALLQGGPPSDWWLRAASLAVLCYLMSPGVRAAFHGASQGQPVAANQWLVGWQRRRRRASI